MSRPASLCESNISPCFYYYSPPQQCAKVAGQSDRHLRVWVSMTEIPKGMPGPFPSCSMGTFALFAPSLQGSRDPFVTLPALPPQHTAKQQYNLMVNHTLNTTAEHDRAFSGMAYAPNCSVHKSGGRKRGNKQRVWHCCGLHVQHPHTQVIHCVRGTTPEYLWHGVLINS